MGDLQYISYRILRIVIRGARSEEEVPTSKVVLILGAFQVPVWRGAQRSAHVYFEASDLQQPTLMLLHRDLSPSGVIEAKY